MMLAFLIKSTVTFSDYHTAPKVAKASWHNFYKARYVWNLVIIIKASTNKAFTSVRHYSKHFIYIDSYITLIIPYY